MGSPWAGGWLGDPKASAAPLGAAHLGNLHLTATSSPLQCLSSTGSQRTCYNLCGDPAGSRARGIPPPHVLGSPQAGGRSGERAQMGLHPCLGMCQLPQGLTQ